MTERIYKIGEQNKNTMMVLTTDATFTIDVTKSKYLMFAPATRTLMFLVDNSYNVAFRSSPYLCSIVGICFENNEIRIYDGKGIIYSEFTTESQVMRARCIHQPLKIKFDEYNKELLELLNSINIDQSILKGEYLIGNEIPTLEPLPYTKFIIPGNSQVTLIFNNGKVISNIGIMMKNGNLYELHGDFIIEIKEDGVYLNHSKTKLDGSSPFIINNGKINNIIIGKHYAKS